MAGDSCCCDGGAVGFPIGAGMCDEDVEEGPLHAGVAVANASCPDAGFGSCHGARQLGDVDVGFVPAVVFVLLTIGIGVDPEFDSATYGDNIMIKQLAWCVTAVLA